MEQLGSLSHPAQSEPAVLRRLAQLGNIKSLAVVSHLEAGEIARKHEGEAGSRCTGVLAAVRQCFLRDPKENELDLRR